MAYESVRQALVAVGAAYGKADSYPAAVKTFEARRAAFLEKARAILQRTDEA
jgi:hypothetical protein